MTSTPSTRLGPRPRTRTAAAAAEDPLFGVGGDRLNHPKENPEQKPCTAVDAHLKPLAGLTLRELVCSRKAHELVRGCLRALVAPSSSDKVKPYARGPTTWRGNWARRAACSFGAVMLTHAASLQAR